MSMLAVKLRRDLRASWPRFALMMVALAVSLTVFGGILSAWAIASRETGGAYLSTEPASATIVLEDGVDTETMADIAAEARQRPQVIEATGRTQFTSEVEVDGEPGTVPLQAFVAAPDDPMRMVRFDLRNDWPPADGEILLGGDGSAALLGVDIGDVITIKEPPARLRVAGTVYDPSLAPSMQEQKGHGYLASTSIPLNQLKIQVADPGQSVPSRDRDTIMAVAGDVTEWLRRDHGLTVAEIQVPKPYAHPHQWQADVLLLSLLAGAGAALLLASILVATMLNNLFTQQIPQIGIMKAIGARSVRIGRLYLAMTLLVAAAATALATVPALLLGTNLVGGLLTMLGIRPASLGAPWWTYLVIIAVGLVLPPLMALSPLIRASRTTVRAAIDHHGGAKTSKATGVLARLARLRRLDRGLLMALRNTVRRPARFWLSVGLLASAGTVFVAGMSLRSGTQAADEERTARRYWDVEAELAAPTRPDAITGAVARLPDVERVETWYRAEVGVAGPGEFPFTRTYPDQGHGSVAVNTVSASTTVPPVVAGRWLRPGETGAVVLNQNTRDATVPGLDAGDTVRLFIDGRPTTWLIAGIVAEGDSTGGGVYTTAEGFAAATGKPPQVNQLRVITGDHDETTRQAVADAVRSTLTGSGIEVASADSVSRGTAASSAHFGPVLLVLLGVGVPLGVLGAIGLAATMSANVLDRTREFGVMHAIGARPTTVRRVVVAEGLFLALTSCVIAALPTVGLTALLGTGLGNLFGGMALPLRISLLGAGMWIVFVIAGAAIATDAAATRASRITVREALTYL